MEALLPSPKTAAVATTTIDPKSTDPQAISQQKETHLRNKSRKGSISIVSKESKSSFPYSINKNTITQEKKQRQQQQRNENLPKSPIQIHSKISNSDKEKERITDTKQELNHLTDSKKSSKDDDNTVNSNSPSENVGVDSTSTPNTIIENDVSKPEQPSQLLTPPE
ncbi:1892_t:CDS:1, partial [Ambispora leptoticha]